jgi:hypothetical protein
MQEIRFKWLVTQQFVQRRQHQNQVLTIQSIVIQKTNQKRHELKWQMSPWGTRRGVAVLPCKIPVVVLPRTSKRTDSVVKQEWVVNTPLTVVGHLWRMDWTVLANQLPKDQPSINMQRSADRRRWLLFLSYLEFGRKHHHKWMECTEHALDQFAL